jgi:hypothetical protein
MDVRDVFLTFPMVITSTCRAMLRDVHPGAGTPVDYQEAFLMMREMLFM